MRIAVIPTGRMEWEALPQALHELFPGHQFECLPSRAELASNAGIEFPIPSFTSCDATRLFGTTNTADKLLGRAAAEALGDRRRPPADLVVVIDDLELCNRFQPQAVVQVVKEAAQRHLAGLETRAHIRTRTALRERVSFHLAVPMIESWLFADPRGPANAGAPADRPSRLRVTDPEDFETDDEAYATATADACTFWSSLPVQRKKKLRPVWAGNHDRTWHPKGYLTWLCLDPAAKSCTSYDESNGGARALASLDWKRALGRSRMPFLRSLVADIADALEQEPSVGPVHEHQAPLTSRQRAPRDAILRNL
jgi:hypothetical protein